MDTESIDWWSVLSPPEMGALIAPSLPAQVLSEIWQQTPEIYNSPLDAWEVASALLATGDLAKEALVLRYFRGSFEADVFQSLLECAKKSRGHAVALASNDRFWWRDHRRFAEQLLEDVFPYSRGERGQRYLDYKASDWESLVSAALANPAFDLSTVADLIRGSGPFAKVPAEARSDVADEALLLRHRRQTAMKRMRQTNGEQTRDRLSELDYEIDLTKPVEALFSLVKSGDYSGSFRVNPSALLVPGGFGVSQDDWLHESERAEDFTERRNLALGRFVRWIADYVKDEPLDVEGAESYQSRELFSKGNFAVVSIFCALREMSSDYQEQMLQELKDSQNWVARAAYYTNEISALADLNGDKRAQGKKARELAKVLERDDLAFVRGAFCNERTGALDSRGMLPSELTLALRLRDGAASKGFFANLDRLPGLQLEDDTADARSREEVYEIETLLTAIKSEERAARFAPFIVFGFMGLFLLSTNNNPADTVLIFLLLFAAFLAGAVFNLRVMHLKAELRETIRHGPAPDTPAWVEADKNVRKARKRRAWPFIGRK